MNIGIIGGSDGPTMIFISSGAWKWLIVIAAAIAAIAGAAIFFIERKKKNKGAKNKEIKK